MAMVSSGSFHRSSLQPPDTPIMLYIGAGYDFSPLLTFSPQGSHHPIVPLDKNANFRYPAKESYTSFIFVDAKPRHTYAFMVSDFEEWKDVDSRVKNVLHYSQGLLTRWRCVPGADDLIWFEGGGDEVHASKRVSDPNWHCIASDTTDSTITTTAARLFSRKRTTERLHQPLTTVYYLFNTLDIEMTRSPRMEKMWANVEALYVHGLMIHRSTGHGPSSRSVTMPNSLPTKPSPDVGLGANLKRVYVLVGSWSGKTGVRHVDFIKEARARSLRMRPEDLSALSPTDNPRSQLHHNPTLMIECDPSSNPTPAPFVHKPLSRQTSISSFTAYNLFPSTSSDNNSLPVVNHRSTPQQRPSLDSLSSVISIPSVSSHDDISSSEQDFHIPIPQIAWSDKLNNGKGGYYISRTVEDCRRLVPAQQRSKEISPETVRIVEKSVSRRLWTLKLFSTTRSATKLERPPARRPRRRPLNLRLDSPAVRVTGIDVISVSQQDVQSPASISTSQNQSQASSFEYYSHEGSSQTTLSPTSTIFVPPTSTTIPQRLPQSWPSPVSSQFLFTGGDLESESCRFEDDLPRANRNNTISPLTPIRKKLIFFRRLPFSRQTSISDDYSKIPK